MNNRKIKALVIGHTGATGKALLEALISASEVESIVAIGRREVEGFHSSKLTQHVTSDMFNLEKLDKNIGLGANAAFCCIGTPFNDVMNKNKQDEYRKVDFGIPTSFANFAKSIGVDFFTVITGEGTEKEANKDKNMYRVKQDVEKHVEKLNFNRVAFIRPGFLNRGKDAGLMEKLMLPGIFGISVSQVAKSMLWTALNQEEKVAGYTSNKTLKAIANTFDNRMKK